ncbi:MAG: DUF805 domain-containing protein, partial [Actinomycetota bacterium]
EDAAVRVAPADLGGDLVVMPRAEPVVGGEPAMDMIEYYKLVVLERYAKFDGRAGRAEYWWFFLANVIIGAIIQVLAQAADVIIILGFLYWLAILIPNIAVSIRRLHDTGKSGWLLLLFLVPLIGPIILLVFFVLEGDSAANQYGPPDPGLPATA